MSRPASPDAGEHPPGKTIDGGQPSPTGAEVSEGRGPVSRGMSRDSGRWRWRRMRRQPGRRRRGGSGVAGRSTAHRRGKGRDEDGRGPDSEGGAVEALCEVHLLQGLEGLEVPRTGFEGEGEAEFHAALKDGASSDITWDFFSLVGIRGDTDFMIMAESASLEPFQSLVSKLLFRRSSAGTLEIPYSYLAMTRRSRYIGAHKHAGQEGTSEGAGGEGGQQQKPEAGSRFLFVYPFMKKREVVQARLQRAAEVMAEHFKIRPQVPCDQDPHGLLVRDGRPGVRAHRSRETSPAEFLALVEELRELRGQHVYPARDADIHLLQAGQSGCWSCSPLLG